MYYLFRNTYKISLPPIMDPTFECILNCRYLFIPVSPLPDGGHGEDEDDDDDAIEGDPREPCHCTEPKAHIGSYSGRKKYFF